MKKKTANKGYIFSQLFMEVQIMRNTNQLKSNEKKRLHRNGLYEIIRNKAVNESG